MTDPNLPSDPRHRAVPPASPPAPPAFGAVPPASPPTPPAFTPAPPASNTFGETSFVSDTTTVQDRVDKPSGMVARVGLVAAALAVAGGGAFAVTRALSEPAGAQSPEEAVNQLFVAVENEDLVGLTEMMLPSEREAMVDPMIDLFAELERLDLLDEDYDPGAAAEAADGLDVTVTGLDFTTTPIGDGVVNARMTAGVVRVTGDVGDLPFGDRADQELGAEVLSESIDEQVVDFAEETDAVFTIVEEDGSWYLSLWYSVAEAARAEAGEPAPAFGAGVVPVGGDSPEGALRLMLEEAFDLDAEGVISSLDPAEFRALYDYAPLFLDDADAAVAELRQELDAEGITWSLDRLDLSRSQVRDRTVVGVDGFAFSATGQGQAVSVDFDGDCITVIIDQEIDEVCITEISNELDDEMGGAMNGLELPQAYRDFLDDYTTGVTVVDRDGRWYVSGMPTIIGVYTDLLASLEPSDIDDFKTFFEESVNGAFGPGGFAGAFGGPGQFGQGQFVPIEDDPFFQEEDPFFEEISPSIEGDEPFAPLELPQEALDVLLDDIDFEASDPEYSYFAGETGFPATWYAYAYDFDTGASVEVLAFEATGAELIAALEGSFAYERVDVGGLPEGAVAFDWPDVDRVVVVDNFLVSAYFSEDGSNEALLSRQVEAIANR